MKFRIDREGAGLCIRIEGVTGREQALVDAIRRCRQSAWACQSGECVNVESIAEGVAGGVVVLTLRARPGNAIDAAGIEQCLRYLLPGAVKA